MGILQPKLDGLTEYNTIKELVEASNKNEDDIDCCYFNNCYEAHIETFKTEFN